MNTILCAKSGATQKTKWSNKITFAALISSLICTVLCGLVTQAKAEPSESPKQALERAKSDGLRVSAALTKNIFHQEPYQDTETYYEDVPYQDTETYTDYEDYTTTEYICHSETSYENQCEQVTECDRVFGLGINKAIIGTSSLSPMRERPPGVGPEPYPGDPDPSPTPREPHPTPSCSTRTVCHNVPVSRNVCDYETVVRTRPVTKTRTVTKYRKEARSRVVTRYRDVFDYQASMNVQVLFPQGSELTESEKESFTIALSANGNALDVDLIFQDTVFGYSLVSKQITGSLATIQLGLQPKYTKEAAASASIESLKMNPDLNKIKYQFRNLLLSSRVVSAYQLVLVEKSSKQLVAQSEVTSMSSSSDLTGELAVQIDETKEYIAILKVHREGVVLEGQVIDFQVESEVSLKVDYDAVKSDKFVSAQIIGLGSSAQIKMTDKTKDYALVTSKYVVTLVRKGFLGKNISIVSKSFSRKALQMNSNGEVLIPIAQIGISSSDLQEYIAKDQKINVVIEVNRALPDGTKVQFWKDNWQSL